MAAVDAPLAHARGDRAEWVRKLAELVRIPSVSVGLKDVRLIETPGNPAVYAQWRSARPAPTLLIYGHYDVVGPEPLSQWRSPPFSPLIRGRFLHGRGASDDKGPLLCHLAAIQAWLKASGRLPVNVRCVFEGEEEIGSPHLEPVLRAVGAGVDAAVISDTRMLAPGRPALIVGLRGSLAAELEVRGPDQDSTPAPSEVRSTTRRRSFASWWPAFTTSTDAWLSAASIAASDHGTVGAGRLPSGSPGPRC